MALTVEDGSGVAGADALASAAFVATYIEEYYGEAGFDDDPAIRRATAWLNAQDWKGQRVEQDQATAWPRENAYVYGEKLPKDEVPLAVQQGVAVLARAESATTGTLAPTVDITQRTKSVSVGGGAVSTSYFAPPAGADSSRAVITAARDLIGAYLIGGGSGGVAFVQRS